MFVAVDIDIVAVGALAVAAVFSTLEWSLAEKAFLLSIVED